jgi:hypothetical protein
MVDNDASEFFGELRMQQLSAVTFVHDYLQLWFDGRGVNVANPLTVESAGSRIVSWEPGFRDLLCAQIGKAVTVITYSAGEALTFVLNDGSRLEISLKADDCRAPEAVYAHGFKNGGVWVE